MFLLLFVGEFHRLNPPRPTTPPIEDSNMLQVDSLKGDVPELCVNEGSLPLDRLLRDVCVCVDNGCWAERSKVLMPMNDGANFALERDLRS